jgi:CheY-specific phosphatase CheX
MSKTEMELYQTAALTFEELAFMFATPELIEEVMEKKPEATAEVKFHGPINGHLVVSLCGDILAELAANMLGENEPPQAREQLDALGEVANVICGNILPKLTDPTSVFHIDAPSVTAGGTSTATILRPAASISLPLTDGRADLVLYIQ